MNLTQRPEDNLVRTVVRAVAMFFHPEFRDELNPATRARLMADRRMKEQDMRWKLPSHQNTSSDEEVRHLRSTANHCSGGQSLRDRE